MAVAPRAVSDRASSSSLSADRATRASKAPRFAASSARQRPMPLEAPVISIRLHTRSRTMLPFPVRYVKRYLSQAA